MDIAGIIKNLLYHHNCVIIPGFGGLVAEYAPAQIHPIQHIFLPPHKSIAFNRSIKLNDGLLVAAIAREENISYELANGQVMNFVRQIETGLKNKGSFILPAIGRFYYDVEKNLLFKPEDQLNYLLPAFGLDQFIAQPVMRREEVISAIENSFIEPKKKRGMNWMGLGLVVALVALIFQVFVISSGTSKLKIQETGVFRYFNELFTRSESKNSASENNTTHSKDTLIQIVIIQNSTSHPVDTAAIIAGATATEANKAPVATVAPNASPVITTINSGDYYIIFGCFKGKRAPQVLIEELKQKGITADIVIDDSYRRVGTGGFATKEDALTQMRNYHAQGVKDAWVMKR